MVLLQHLKNNEFPVTLLRDINALILFLKNTAETVLSLCLLMQNMEEIRYLAWL